MSYDTYVGITGTDQFVFHLYSYTPSPLTRVITRMSMCVCVRSSRFIFNLFARYLWYSAKCPYSIPSHDHLHFGIYPLEYSISPQFIFHVLVDGMNVKYTLKWY